MRSVGEEQLAVELEREVRRLVQPLLCERLRPIADKLASRVVLLNPIVRVVRAAHSFVDGLWQDVEDFQVVGVRVPRAVTVPVRDFIDRVGELLDSVDELIAEVVELLDFFDEECSDGDKE